MTEQFVVTFDLDVDGFLRRECPHCELEFKWLPTDAGAPDSYHCPYCTQTAASDQWFTKQQAAYLDSVVHETIVEPMIDGLQKTVDEMNIDGGLIKISARLDRSPAPKGDRPTDPNDMRRVEFACHPDEPLKVLDDWNGPPHCLVCGAPEVSA
jgi:hypothetical protein